MSQGGASSPQNGAGAISPLEAMLAAVGLAMTTDSANSISASSDSVKLVGVDIDGGSKPASPMVDHSGDSNARSNPTSPGVVYLTEKNNNGLKLAGESGKGEGKDELPRGDGSPEDAAIDSGGMGGSNSKLMRSSSDSDSQDAVKDDPKPAATNGSSSSNNNKGKGKHAAAEMNHKVHIWTEKERRKKMKNMYSTLQSLLPRLPDKVSIGS